MASTVLAQLLVLLAFSVLVVAVFRRFDLPPIVGYLAVGMLLGPQGLHLASSGGITNVLAEMGVVFLVFTLGLEFSLARMMAMRRDVFVIGGGQVAITTALFAAVLLLFKVPALVAVLIGGALAMSSTAIVIGQLSEQLEINRTHGRLAVGILLFQDLAFVPLLALEGAVAGTTQRFDAWSIAIAIAEAAVALAVVLLAGRALVRPAFFEIARSRSMELFTHAALLLALGAAWASHAAGLSTALGAFLAGMLLGETEYRHQVESVIRPFRDVLLGLFFITIGTLLDMRLLFEQGWLVLLLVFVLSVVKTAVVVLVATSSAGSWTKALRTGLVVAQGGEFGFAILTLMLNDQLASPAIVQPLLAAIVVSMALSPFVIRHSERLTRLFTHKEEEPSDLERELASTRDAASRPHVIVCGYGRVGQNLARALERQGFEYIALDMDPQRTRAARNAGEPVIYGDATQGDMLRAVGIDHCSVLVITFAAPEVALRILHTVRELRTDLPVLVRTQDDRKLEELQRAGATEVVPETLEASLMLVSHVLMLLDVPISRVVRVVGDARAERYSMLRGEFRGADAALSIREELRTVPLTRGARAVGKSLRSLALDTLGVSVTALRRDGIVGREPDLDLELREDDVLVLYGTPEAIAVAESVLLMG
ncbi:MAG TPA: cation:proton antiporter [Steroidobacteraceae bacterium]|nr:cation:proton antiporter [Steroidobacteraceae bacterium]